MAHKEPEEEWHMIQNADELRGGFLCSLLTPEPGAGLSGLTLRWSCPVLTASALKEGNPLFH